MYIEFMFVSLIFSVGGLCLKQACACPPSVGKRERSYEVIQGAAWTRQNKSVFLAGFSGLCDSSGEPAPAKYGSIFTPVLLVKVI